MNGARSHLRYRALSGVWSLALALAACHDDEPSHVEVDPWPVPNVGQDYWPGYTSDAGFMDSGADAGMTTPPDYDTLRSEFDPEQIYVFGSAQPTTCSRNAIAPLAKPSEVIRELPCGADLLQIRPSDGRLFYRAAGAIYRFSADVAGGSAQTNDTRVPTPRCSSNKAFEGFVISAASELFYACGQDWYDERDRLIASAGSVFSVAADGVALTSAGVHLFGQPVDGADAAIPGPADASFGGFDAGDGAVDAGDGAGDEAADSGQSAEDAGMDAGGMPMGAPRLRPFVGMPDVFTVITARARADGFWVALFVGPAAEQLWHVDLDGRASMVGTFAAAPSGQSLVRSDARLDAEGALIQRAADLSQGLRPSIVRRTAAGEFSVVVDEAASPKLSLHAAFLVTGP